MAPGAGLLLGLGVVLFAGATTGLVVVLDEDITVATSPTGLFDISYSTARKEIDTASGAGQTGKVEEFNVQDRNVTKVTVTISCSQSAGSPAYTFSVKVEGPNKQMKTETGACGPTPTVVTIDVAAVPEKTTVQANDAKEATAKIGGQANETQGTGTWTVTASGGRGGALPGGLDPAIDPPNWTTKLDAEIWTAAATAVGK